jgi:hypothetical protein
MQLPLGTVAAADAFGFADAPSGGLDGPRPSHSDGIFEETCAGHGFHGPIGPSASGLEDEDEG